MRQKLETIFISTKKNHSLFHNKGLTLHLTISGFVLNENRTTVNTSIWDIIYFLQYTKHT